LGDRAANPNAPGLDIDIFYVQSGWPDPDRLIHGL
jgi:hypothetical protein